MTRKNLLQRYPKPRALRASRPSTPCATGAWARPDTDQNGVREEIRAARRPPVRSTPSGRTSDRLRARHHDPRVRSLDATTLWEAAALIARPKSQTLAGTTTGVERAPGSQRDDPENEAPGEARGSPTLARKEENMSVTITYVGTRQPR